MKNGYISREKTVPQVENYCVPITCANQRPRAEGPVDKSISTFFNFHPRDVFIVIAKRNLTSNLVRLNWNGKPIKIVYFCTLVRSVQISFHLFDNPQLLLLAKNLVTARYIDDKLTSSYEHLFLSSSLIHFLFNLDNSIYLYFIL